MRAPGYVYVLHFHAPLERSSGGAYHYVGWARNWVYRVQAHRSGTARARFTEVAFERGITFDVAVVVRGGPRLERRIKRAHHHARYCPACGGNLLTDYRTEFDQ